MIRDLIQTFSSRLVALVASFLMLVITTRLLGTEGRGEVALFTAGVSFFVLFSGFFGGPAFTYLASRREVHTLLAAHARIQLILAVPVFCFMYLTTPLSIAMLMLATVSGILLGWVTQVQNVLIGLNRLSNANNLNTYQTIGVLLLIAVAFVFPDARYPWVYGLSSVVTFAALAIYGHRQLLPGNFNWTGPIDWKLLWMEGWKSQLSNLVQLVNYRMSFYFLAWYVSESSVGLFSVAVALGEAVWLAGRSFATVILARMSPGLSAIESHGLVKRGIVFTAMASLVGLCCLMLVPEVWWQSLFTRDVRGLAHIIMLLSPGIFALSLQMPISHYFAAKGKFLVNARAACFGCFPALVLHIYLVPVWYGVGAATATSIGYILSAAYTTAAYWRIRST